jgi:hypothetical protein
MHTSICRQHLGRVPNVDESHQSRTLSAVSHANCRSLVLISSMKGRSPATIEALGCRSRISSTMAMFPANTTSGLHQPIAISFVPIIIHQTAGRRYFAYPAACRRKSKFGMRSPAMPSSASESTAPPPFRVSIC